MWAGRAESPRTAPSGAFQKPNAAPLLPLQPSSPKWVDQKPPRAFFLTREQASMDWRAEFGSELRGASRPEPFQGHSSPVFKQSCGKLGCVLN